LAYEHNEIARKYRPENTQVLYNKNYLEGVLGKNKKQELDNGPANISEEGVE